MKDQPVSEMTDEQPEEEFTRLFRKLDKEERDEFIELRKQMREKS